MNSPRATPRRVPGSAGKQANFTPRRSYARARASREKVAELARMERNHKSQRRFARNLKIAVNLICLGGIVALLFYAFSAPKPEKDRSNARQLPASPAVTPR